MTLTRQERKQKRKEAALNKTDGVELTEQDVLILSTTVRRVRVLRDKDIFHGRCQGYKGTAIYWGLLIARQGNKRVLVRYVDENNIIQNNFFRLDRVEIL